jgi:hypothetical protein
MGCGCNKGAAASGYVHVAPDGTKTEKRTEIEAKAMVIRQGGSYEPKK